MVPFFLLLLPLLAFQCQAGKPYYDPEDAEHHFEQFVATYNKQYSSEAEKSFRFNVFKQNLRKINEYNARQRAIFGINEFTDLTDEEFRRFYTGVKVGDVGNYTPGVIPVNMTTPDTFDWRDKGAVTEVKNQQRCNSAWAFTTTGHPQYRILNLGRCNTPLGNLEGQYAVKHGKLVELSEQQLIDCDVLDNGCDGGSNGYALLWLSHHGGSVRESDYPYVGTNQTCQNKTSGVVQVVGMRLYLTSEDVLKDVLIYAGPLSIELRIDAASFSKYKGGIYDCNGAGSDHHVMLLVGYGNDKGRPYWIIKNSWGTSWGVEGYLWMAMGVNSCDLTTIGITTGMVG